jgi:OOP family OmpA-OmpF porin
MNRSFHHFTLGAAAVLAVAGCDVAITVRGTPPIPVRAARPPVEVKVETPPPPKRVGVTETQVQFNEKILFATAKWDILPDSHGLLNEVAQVLKQHPRIRRIEVAGHTDSRGTRAANQKLSENRAKSVWAFLVKAGIDPARMVHKGYGQDRPIADNATEEGREKNRRVEFNILEQAAPAPVAN